jgi:hypothetical protein
MPNCRDVDFHSRAEGVEIFIFDSNFVADPGVVDQNSWRANLTNGFGNSTFAIFSQTQVDGNRD